MRALFVLALFAGCSALLTTPDAGVPVPPSTNAGPSGVATLDADLACTGPVDTPDARIVADSGACRTDGDCGWDSSGAGTTWQQCSAGGATPPQSGTCFFVCIPSPRDKQECDRYVGPAPAPQRKIGSGNRPDGGLCPCGTICRNYFRTTTLAVGGCYDGWMCGPRG